MIRVEDFKYKEAVLKITAEADLFEKIRERFTYYYDRVEEYCSKRPEFMYSLEPLRVDKGAEEIIRRMAEAGSMAGVGPMAAVAGGIAQMTVEEIVEEYGPDKLIIENGGDIVLFSRDEVFVRLFCGNPKYDRLALRVRPEGRILSVCSSSGKIGHSLSFGEADISTVIASDGFIADAFATGIGNLCKKGTMLKRRLGEIAEIDQIYSVFVIFRERVFIAGLPPEMVSIKDNG